MSIVAFIKKEEQNLENIFHQLPEVARKFGAEGVYVINQIKLALNSKESAEVEAVLNAMFPGNWEAEVISKIGEAFGIAIPALTIIEGATSVIDMVKQLLTYLATLMPKLRNGAFYKLLSGVLQALDPTLTEVEADTAAQIVYAQSI